jgi:hypothetical protein
MIRIEVQEFVLQKKKKGFQNFEIEMWLQGCGKCDNISCENQIAKGRDKF